MGGRRFPGTRNFTHMLLRHAFLAIKHFQHLLRERELGRISQLSDVRNICRRREGAFSPLQTVTAPLIALWGLIRAIVSFGSTSKSERKRGENALVFHRGKWHILCSATIICFFFFCSADRIKRRHRRQKGSPVRFSLDKSPSLNNPKEAL